MEKRKESNARSSEKNQVSDANVGPLIWIWVERSVTDLRWKKQQISKAKS